MFGWLNLTELNNMERLRLGRTSEGRGEGREEDKAGLEEKASLPDVSRALTPSLRDDNMISTRECVKAALFSFLFLMVVRK